MNYRSPEDRNRPGYFWLLARRIGLLMAVTLLLNGCSMKFPVNLPGKTTPASPPAPVPRSTVPAPELAPPPSVHRESVSVPEEGKAAGTLLASARKSEQAGQFSQAEMTLERALRVEPRNARLWHEMAQVKFGQKDYGQTVQFCIKSNSLAGKDYELIRQNWLLMEKAYLELGEPEKARQARIKSG